MFISFPRLNTIYDSTIWSVLLSYILKRIKSVYFMYASKDYLWLYYMINIVIIYNRVYQKYFFSVGKVKNNPTASSGCIVDIIVFRPIK